MPTWMQHSEHGKHPAHGSEIELMKSNGWTECAFNSPKKPALLDIAFANAAKDIELIGDGEVPEKKKRGRPVRT